MLPIPNKYDPFKLEENSYTVSTGGIHSTCFDATATTFNNIMILNFNYVEPVLSRRTR